MNAAVVIFNSTAYAYLYNLQGDVIGLLDSNGTKMVSYTYDAWGKMLSKTGTLAGTLGTIQPFRYRGYVYDEETGLYFMRSRYYCASKSRFLNGDCKVITAPVLGANMFVYTRSNPTNMLDTDGKDAIWIQERDSAAGFGHTGLMVQDSDDNWYYFFWGPVSENIELELITGTDTNSYVQYVDTHGIVLTDKESVVDALLGSADTAPDAASRASMITDVYYFEGDYTATLTRAQKIVKDSKNYKLLTNNCLQNTVDALMASDNRFSQVIYGGLNAVIPNSAASKVSMFPREKDKFPWKLFFYNMFLEQ